MNTLLGILLGFVLLLTIIWGTYRASGAQQMRTGSEKKRNTVQQRRTGRMQKVPAKRLSFLRQIRTAYVSLFTVLIVLGVVNIGGTAAFADSTVVALPTLPNPAVAGVPGWVKVENLKAVWLVNGLTRDAVYWATDKMDGNPGSATGSQETMLGQSYAWSDDLSDYQTREVMRFERTAAYKSSSTYPNANGHFSDANQFSTQAMGIFGGSANNPNGQLSVYYFAHDGATGGQNYVKCPTNFSTVVRVTDQSPDIYVGCMPPPGTSGGYPQKVAGGNPYMTGGEVDQYTGYLYVESTWANLDSQSYNSKNANDSSVRFSVWDPVTGAYTLSGAVQPAGFVSGSISKERMAISSYNPIDYPNCPYGKDGKGSGCSYDYASASADMGLDALGNAYLYTGMQSSATNAVNMSIVRLVPSRDQNGNYVDGTAAQPWTYNLVTKVKQEISGQYWQSGINAVGVGILNGKFLLGGYIEKWPTSTAGGTAENTANSSYDTASSMVRVDPLSGGAAIVKSSSNGTGINASGSSYYPGTSTQIRDDASAQSLRVITGSIYNDTDGDGQLSGAEQANLLSGQTVALYDSTGKLVSSQQTSDAGSYSFILSSNGTYYVRLVQPQVAGINAYQTWGSVVSGSDTLGNTTVATMYCTNGNIAGTAAGSCQGALQPPYVDAKLGKLGTTGNVGAWPQYAAVEVNTDSVVPKVDFAVSTVGSYGDAPNPPFNSTVAQNGPVLLNPIRDWLYLGNKPGLLSDGVNSSDANGHSTDDGISLVTQNNQLLPLQGQALVSGKTYTLRASANGTGAEGSFLTAWQSNAGGTALPSSAPIFSTTVSGNAATGSITVPALAAGTSESPVFSRFILSSSPVTVPDNSTGMFMPALGSSAADTQAWVNPGEIEDYMYYDVSSIIRISTVLYDDQATSVPFTYALTGVSNTSPSSTTDSVVLSSSGVQITSPAVHVPTGGGAITIDGTNTTGNYQLISDVVCTDTVTGVSIPSTMSSGTSVSFTAPASSDITCAFRYSDIPKFELPLAGSIPWLTVLGGVLVLCGGCGVLMLLLWRRWL